jgi:hypothetical protein
MQPIIFTNNQISDCYHKLIKNYHRLINRNNHIEMLNDNDILLLLQVLINVHHTIKIGLIDSQLSSLIMNDYLNNKETNVKTLDTFLEYFIHKYDILTIPLCFKTHWSLIIYIRLYDKLIYLDSLNNYHCNYINKFYSMLKTYNINIKDLVYVKSIKQDDNWECGYYIIIFFHLSIRLFNQRDKFGKEQYHVLLESLLTKKFNLQDLLQLFTNIIYIQIKRNEYNEIK